jgi:hypothetical protein
MSGAMIAIWPIALLIAAAIVGVPLWMTLRHRHATPDYGAARGHDRAKQATPGAATLSEATTSDFVPTKPVAAVDELTIVRKTGTGDDGVAVPVQRHW